jgi:MerR family mercuric resistance operon transcriptional regulator
MTPLSTGSLARLSGVGVETLRFYEQQGLLEEPPRRASGYRQYPPAAVFRLHFIRRAKELGFSLQEIRELLALSPAADGSCEEVQESLRAKRAEIDRKIEDLKRIRRALETVAAACTSGGRGTGCPFLEALAEEGAP